MRIKVFGYSLLFRLQRFLAGAIRTLPGSWKLLGVPSKRISDVEAWVAETRLRRITFGEDSLPPTFTTFGSPSRIARVNTPPPGVNGVHPELRGECLELVAPYLVSVPHARLLGPDGAVITPDGGILEQSSRTTGLLQQHRIYRAFTLPRPRYLPGSYYTIAGPHAEGYYHWLIEILPRLFAYSSVAESRPRLIVNAPLSKWQVESLALLGFAERDTFALGSEYIHVQNLYFPSIVGINPHTLRWLKDALSAPLAPARPCQRIYITRRRAARRRLVNEAQLEPIVSEHGFAIVELESLSFVEQVQLFAEAEMIVALHGAGLCNMLFAPAGCKVMEIIDPMHVGVMYYMLCETLGYRYYWCMGQSVINNSQQHGGAHGHDDVAVSIDGFRESLARLVNV